MSIDYRIRAALNEFERINKLRIDAGIGPYYSGINTAADYHYWAGTRKEYFLAALNEAIDVARQQLNAHNETVKVPSGGSQIDPSRPGERTGPEVHDSRVIKAVLGIAALAVVLGLASRAG